MAVSVTGFTLPIYAPLMPRTHRWRVIILAFAEEHLILESVVDE
jgi:hypothetical protein